MLCVLGTLAIGGIAGVSCARPARDLEPVRSVRGPGLRVAPEADATSDSAAPVDTSYDASTPDSGAGDQDANTSASNGTDGTDSTGSTGSAQTLSPSQTATAQPAARLDRLSRGTGTASDRALAAGDKAYDKRRWDQAIAAYNKAARLAPQDPAPVVGLVRARLAKVNAPTEHASAPNHPQLVQAVEQLQQALQRDGNYGPAHAELGHVLLVLDQADRATASLEKAVRAMPSEAEAHSALGVARLATGQIVSACKSLQRAAEIEPNNAARLTNWATALLMDAKYEQAARLLERALVLDPSNPRIQTDLGTTYLTLNDTHRALPHLQKAVDQQPNKATYRSNLGYGLQRTGRLTQAVAQYRQAIALDPNLASAWINLGTALVQLNDVGQARKAFEKAASLNPEDPRPGQNLRDLDELESKP